MRSALIDTNLLLLLVVGHYDKTMIRQHRRTRIFTEADYDLLVRTIDQYGKFWVTSHCVAEASNLLRPTDRDREGLWRQFKEIASIASESHIRKELIFAEPHASRLGVADTGIVVKSKRVSHVFTVDLELYIELSRLGRPVTNFNHLRTSNLLS